MPAKSTSKGADQWLSLSRAAAFLGVHPGTLRAWADRGEVPAHRTPGGHRRFWRADLEARLAAERRQQPRPDIQIVIHSALGRARMETSGGSLDEVPWYRRFDEPAREQHRKLGRELLGLLLRYLSDTAGREELLAEARRHGRRYGRLSRHLGLALDDAVRAFLYFRDTLADSVIGLAETLDPRLAHNWADTFRQINTFTNEVLLAMIQAYQTYVEEETVP